MRYLLQFPSEIQVTNYIIVKLEDDEPSKFVKYDKLEPFLVNWLMTNEYAPAPHEQLLAAFRALDTKKEGRIRYDVLENLLTTRGIPLRKEEIDNFKRYALDKTEQWVEYEEYCEKLCRENEKHAEFLLQDYEPLHKK